MSDTTNRRLDELKDRLNTLEGRLEALENPVGFVLPDNCPEVGETVRCINARGVARMGLAEGEQYVVEWVGRTPQEDGMWVALEGVGDATSRRNSGLSGGFRFEVERFAAVPATFTDAEMAEMFTDPPNDPVYDLLTEPRLFCDGDIVRILPFFGSSARNATTIVVGSLAQVEEDEASDIDYVIVRGVDGDGRLEGFELNRDRLELVAPKGGR